MTTSDQVLSEREAAEILKIKPQTLSVWRCTRRYDLPFIRCGRSIRYRLSDLEAWLNRRTVGTTTVES